MSYNRRETINAYWRNHRAAVRDSKDRRANKSVDPQVFMTNKTLLMQVATWIASQGGKAYARKELDRIGVSSAEGIEAIIVKANSLRSRLST